MTKRCAGCNSDNLKRVDHTLSDIANVQFRKMAKMRGGGHIFAFAWIPIAWLMTGSQYKCKECDGYTVFVI